eukprot:3059708-Prymnesium_polylepis.1
MPSARAPFCAPDAPPRTTAFANRHAAAPRHVGWLSEFAEVQQHLFRYRHRSWGFGARGWVRRSRGWHSNTLKRQPTKICSCVADASLTLNCSQCDVTSRSPFGTARAICESSTCADSRSEPNCPGPDRRASPAASCNKQQEVSTRWSVGTVWKRKWVLARGQWQPHRRLHVADRSKVSDQRHKHLGGSHGQERLECRSKPAQRHVDAHVGC